MPRMSSSCQRCGRSVDFKDWEVSYTPEREVIFSIMCRNEDRCMKPWNKLDRIANATFGELFHFKLPSDSRHFAERDTV